MYEVDCDFVSSSRVDHGGLQRLKRGLRKCECVLRIITIYFNVMYFPLFFSWEIVCGFMGHVNFTLSSVTEIQGK